MSRSAPILVACLQIGQRAGETRVARGRRVLEEVAAGPPADVVILPELWEVGYFAFDEYAASAGALSSGTAAALAEIAARRHAIVVAGSFVERDGGRLYNTVVVFAADGRLAGSYRKSHLFGYGSRETEILTPGPGPVVVEVDALRLGLATCFDLRFPSHFAALRSAGADLLVVPAAWPAARLAHWQTLARARAIETQTPLTAVNGCGSCGGVALGGHTTLLDARGETITELSGGDEGWASGTIDFKDTLAWRREFPLEEKVVVA